VIRKARPAFFLPLSIAGIFTIVLLTIAIGCGASNGNSSSDGGGNPPPPPPPSTANQWTWIGGSNTAGANGGLPGVYGTLGTADATNNPGGRGASARWIDHSGNFWLFGGGAAPNSFGNAVDLNDLWEFTPSTNQWIWVSGSSSGDASGVYGTLGTPSTANSPGARDSAATWIDSSGNLWLFGGQGYDATGTNGWLNDLWEFNLTTKEWVWISGSSTVPAAGPGQVGVYGTKAVADAANVPGGRWGALSWADANGKFWLFGGDGMASGKLSGDLNDLWEFNPASKEWIWVSGSNLAYTTGVYGTLGTPATTNVPPGRAGAVSWIDASGNLWLFGGEGYDSVGAYGNLNDLWEFNPSAGTWTWINGSNTVGPNGGQSGVYGTMGTPAAGNVPSGHTFSTSWIDGGGNFWFFGGVSYSSVLGPNIVQDHVANDLWEFSFASKQWGWMGGSNSVGAFDGQPGVYGVLGTSAAANVPGSRSGAASWVDASGKLWLFGGDGVDSTGKQGLLNDLWRYNP
jgi:N-acetylneuraminic acid mutarotase